MQQELLDKLSRLCQPPFDGPEGPLHVGAFTITKAELAEVLEYIDRIENTLLETGMGEDV